MYSGDYLLVLSVLEEALEIYQQLGDHAYIAKTQNALGYVAMLRGDFTQAEKLFWQNLRDYTELGDKTIIAESLEGLTTVFVRTDQAESAIRMAAAAKAIRETNTSQPLSFYRDLFQQNQNG